MWQDKLEREALRTSKSEEYMVSLSQAISLKRIADALEKMEHPPVILEMDTL